MGEKPEGLQLERLDNDKGYSPENCKWGTRSQQQRNKRNNTILTVRGVTACLTELCEHFSVVYGRVQTRLHRGWPIEDAFFKPVELKHTT